jgi:hypothetical protein
VFLIPEAPMKFKYYAKEDPWHDDDDGNHGRPVILARLCNSPGSEAKWNASRQAWEPFPDMLERLVGGDWWVRIDKKRGQRYFDAAAFSGGEIQEPVPREEMNA